jgi:hypothetical protein
MCCDGLAEINILLNSGHVAFRGRLSGLAAPIVARICSNLLCAVLCNWALAAASHSPGKLSKKHGGSFAKAPRAKHGVEELADGRFLLSCSERVQEPIRDVQLESAKVYEAHLVLGRGAFEPRPRPAIYYSRQSQRPTSTVVAFVLRVDCFGKAALRSDC